MTEQVLQFLQYGTPVQSIAQLSSSVTAPFLPALALAAADSPALIPSLLPSLCSNRHVRNALAYAALDYVEIAQSVLDAEAKEEAAGAGAAAAANVSPGLASAAAAAELEHEEDEERGEAWTWVNDDETDECNAFEVSSEKERVRLAVLSLRRRAREFGKEVSQHQERNEGSIWSSDAFLPELLCLLPVTVSRCPTLLSPEVLAEGLLSASCGCPLLVTTFVNNPAIVERGVLAMTHVLSRQIETQEHQNPKPGSPNASEPAASTGKALGVSGTASREISGPRAQEFAPPSTCAQALVEVLVGLCRLAPSFAAICREALVNTCTLAEMALHITLEIFHDELEFLSRLIFPRERTSGWILAFLGTNQKYGDSQPALVPPGSLSEIQGPPPEPKGMSVTHSATKGVATRILDALLTDAKSTWKEKGWSGRLHAHLKLYCVLIRAGDLQPTHEEVDFWLRVLGGTMDHSGGELRHGVKAVFVSERTLQLGISFVCLVPGLSSSSTKNLLHACIANLLRAAMGHANYAVCTPEIELAVWVAVQLLLRRFADIAGLVREALGMHVTVHTASMRDSADAAVAAAVLSDPFVAASAAASLRPSGPVPSCRRRQCLGLKCLEQLLSTSTFARCGVDISDAVMHYICIAGEPIHPVLPSIVQGFTDLSVPAPRARGGLPRFRMRPFSRDSLVKALAPGFALLRNSLTANKESRMDGFSRSINPNKKGSSKKIGQGNPLATAALITYYILSREQIVRSMGVSGGSNSDNRNSLLDDGEDGWWTELLGTLPLRELLMYMETNWPAYEHLLPQWLSTASVVFPERFSAQVLLRDFENAGASFQIHVTGVPVTDDLDWVGPPPTAFSPNITEEMVGVSSAKVDPGAGSRGIQPEVFAAVDGLSINDSEERSSKLPMDVDKEQLDVALSKPSENPKQEEKTESSTTRKYVGRKNLFSMQTVTAVMQKAVENPLPAMRILNLLMSSPSLVTDYDGSGDVGILAEFGVYWKMEAAIVKALVPNLLQDTCPRCLQDEFCSWWRTLPSSTIEYLVPVLWDLVRDPSVPRCGDSRGLNAGQQNAQLRQSRRKAGPAIVTLSSSGFLEEPLKFLSGNVKVFRSPLLALMLDLLLELLIANERISMAAATDGGRDAGIKKDEVAAALVAQDSAVCQILLEACLPNTELDVERSRGPMLEARKLICATLCSMFNRSRLLLKLVHFQGYDIQLIPMMVEGVPDMVQCLDFIGELLQQTQQHQQVFVVALTAQLTSFYPDLPQSLIVAQQVVGQVAQMRTKVAGCASYLQEVLGPVAQCASTFPSLATQVVALLQSCAQAGGPLTRSGPPRDEALHSAAVAAFKYLVQTKLLHGRPPAAI